MLEINFDPFPLLVTSRLELRQVTEEDAEALFKLRTDERVMKYMDRPRPKKVEEILGLIRQIIDNVKTNNGITWAISAIGDGSLIGTIGLWKIWPENFRAEIGYLLDPAYHGKGIMHEALQSVIEYGLKGLQLHSIIADVNPANEASIRLLERNGFVREGYFTDNYYYNGKFIDTAMYALVNRDEK